MSGWDNTATFGGPIPDPPPGWARWTDLVLARLRARSIDEQLLNGGASNGDPVITVRRARLLNRRYRSSIASSLRKLIDAARDTERPRFAAKLPLRRRQVLDCEPLILTLADELESEDRVSPRGVILADRLIRDGDSPVYGPLPVSRRLDHCVEAAVTHARAALHLG